MKFICVVLLGISAIQPSAATVRLVNTTKYGGYKPYTDEELITEVLQKTPYSSDHNHNEDNAFLTKVFRKYSELGLDGEGEFAGKRAFNKWTASLAAKDILREWKGVTGEEAEAYIESDNYKKIFNDFDYAGNGTIDQKDAYVWARRMVGEEFYGVVSSEEQ